MGYIENSEGYVLLAQIEIAVREFLIKLIKRRGIYEWSKNFLGTAHLESIKEVGKRIFEASENQLIPNIEDIYISKGFKELKQKDGFKTGNLLHPFYYLSWSDLSSLISKNPNSIIIGEEIGSTNRDIIINNLRALNFLRNDIAHSRFINYNDNIFIKSCFNQVSVLLPDFIELCKSQSEEKTVQIFFDNLLNVIQEIETESMLSPKKVCETEIFLEEFTNSFWISSYFLMIFEVANELKTQFVLYKKYRNTPGGLLMIQKWKHSNKTLFFSIKKLINERKI